MESDNIVSTFRASSLDGYLRIMSAFQQIAAAEGRDANHPLFLFRGTKNGDSSSGNPPLQASIEGFRKPNATIHLGRMMFQSFKEKCRFPSAYSDWDLLSFARHLGLPCRMLDWSSNSLVALWFAIHRQGHDGKKDFVDLDAPSCSIWILKTSAEDFQNIKLDEEPFPINFGKTGIFKPTALEERIANQNSFMMRQVYEYKDAKKRTRKAIDMEIKSVEMNPIYRRRMWRIDINRGAFLAIDDDLREYGIREDFLFPRNVAFDFSQLEQIVAEVKKEFK